MSEPLTFFDHQDLARKRSRWAVIGFMLTVLATVVSVSVFAAIGIPFFASEGSQQRPSLDQQLVWLGMVAGVTLLIIVASWLWRLMSLSQGPAAIMNALNADRVHPDTADTDERRLLNLVEEMAIASGVPVPDTYLIRSNSINACATGLEIDKAAVAVTRGALTRLNRAELQGVVAHEFSHILNGDMALNTQMIAWLAGVFTVSELGRVLAYAAMGAGDDDDNDRKGSLPLAAIGAGIWLLGSIGVLFGKMLQAHTNRQREYLADASAVQFTRNPDGLGNALRKLGHRSVRGRLAYANSDCAHLMFSPIRSSSFAGALATHPPLPTRILRILPRWDGTFIDPDPDPVPGQEPEREPTPSPPPTSKYLRDIPSMAIFDGMLRRLELPNRERLEAAATWAASLPQDLRSATRDPEGAQALVFHLLLPPEFGADTVRTPDGIFEMLNRLRATAALNQADRLPLLDLALPALRHLEAADREVFLKEVDRLCELDGSIDLFEYALSKILRDALDPDHVSRPGRRRLAIGNATNSLNVMLSALSRLGAESEGEVQSAFQLAEDYMFGHTGNKKLTLLSAEACGLNALDRACEELIDLNPTLQQRALLAGLAAITHDDQIEPQEAAAFRALAAAMHIPVPPQLGFGQVGT